MGDLGAADCASRAVAGTGLAVVSGAAGWDTAHRVLAALALPPLAALAATAWVSAPAAAAVGARGPRAVRARRAAHRPRGASRVRGARARRDVLVRGADVPRPRRSRAPLRDYVTLTKPRIMSLLLLTGGAGVFVGAGGVPAWAVRG